MERLEGILIQKIYDPGGSFAGVYQEAADFPGDTWAREFNIYQTSDRYSLYIEDITGEVHYIVVSKAVYDDVQEGDLINLYKGE